jgi:Ca2+-binding EF-hand superfamily protein
MSRHVSVVLLLAGLLTAVPCRADAPAPAPAPSRGWLDPLHYCDAVQHGVAGLRQLEAVEMFSAILGGSQLGPGEGWFHPGQSRFGWDWLARRHGIKPTEALTRADFKGPPEVFDRLDRNRDGELTAEDFDWTERSAYFRQASMTGQVFRMFDRDSNGKITREEWEALFNRLAQNKDHVTPDDLRQALFPPMPKSNKEAADGPSPALLLNGLFSGEIGSLFAGPSVGQVAPDFTLHTEDGKTQISLHDHVGRKPVVLVFGSFT